MTEAIQGEESTFTVITKDFKGQIVYSEVDQITVDIVSVKSGERLKTSVTDSKNGRYQVKYRCHAIGDFKISVAVRGEAVRGSPFVLHVKEETTKFSSGIFFLI